MIERTSTSSPSIDVISITNDRSILISLRGNYRRYASDEYPVPKSSTARRTPIALSRSRTPFARTGSFITVLSVISISSAAGRTANRASRGGNFVRELLVQEIARRNVDRHRQGLPLRAPFATLPHRHLQHMHGERRNQPGVLRKGDEHVRGEHPLLWMPPPDQGLDAFHLHR